MKILNKVSATVLILLALAFPALAQNPGVRQQGNVVTDQSACWVGFNVIKACSGASGPYLPLAGGTLTGLLTMTPSAASQSLLVSTGGSNTGSNTSSAVNISWTLNTSGSPDVFALHVTDTARGAATKLFNIYGGAAGNTQVFAVDRNGALILGSGNLEAATNFTIFNNSNSSAEIYFGGASAAYRFGNNTGATDLFWAGGALGYLNAIKGLTVGTVFGGTVDTFLTRGAAATLQLGAADVATTAVAQTLQVQNNTGASSNGPNFSIVGAGGTSVGGNVLIKTKGTTTVSNTWTFDAGGLFTAPGNIFSGGDVRATNGSSIYWNGRSVLSSAADGNVLLANNAGTSFGLLQFGGTSASFPAFKRSSAILQARLADDSAFSQIQGKLTTDNAAVTGLTPGALAALTTATLTITDSTGTVYRVPAITP